MTHQQTMFEEDAMDDAVYKAVKNDLERQGCSVLAREGNRLTVRLADGREKVLAICSRSGPTDRTGHGDGKRRPVFVFNTRDAGEDCYACLDKGSGAVAYIFRRERKVVTLTPETFAAANLARAFPMTKTALRKWHGREKKLHDARLAPGGYKYGSQGHLDRWVALGAELPRSSLSQMAADLYYQAAMLPPYAEEQLQIVFGPSGKLRPRGLRKVRRQNRDVKVGRRPTRSSPHTHSRPTPPRPPRPAQIAAERKRASTDAELVLVELRALRAEIAALPDKLVPLMAARLRITPA